MLLENIKFLGQQCMGTTGFARELRQWWPFRLKIRQVKDNAWKEEEAEVINKAAMDRKMQV